MAEPVPRLYYAGDILGYRVGDNLVFGEASDPDWPFDIKTAVEKPFIQIAENLQIDWQAIQSSRAKSEAILLDRPAVQVGTHVRGPTKVGIVKEKFDVAVVKLLNESACITNVRLDRLTQISEAYSSRQVLFKEHIGEIEGVTHKIRLDYANGSKCSINFEKDNDLYHGATIVPTFYELKRAAWAGGGLNIKSLRILQNFASRAKVTGIHVELLRVNWLFPLLPATDSTVVDIPPQELARNQITEVKYLPSSDLKPEVKANWQMKITELDLENMFETQDAFLIELFAENTDAEDVEGEKRPKLELEALTIGSVQPVQVLLIQSILQIEYEDGTSEEIPSAELSEILSEGSIEIPRREYVIKIDQQEGAFTFGLDLNYYPGEAEQSPMNPFLNPENVKEIRWFRVNQTDPTQVELIGTELVSVFDLESSKLNFILGNSDYVTRGIRNDEFTVGTFSKILDDGKIELKDLDGNLLQRWPTEVSVQTEGNGNACGFLSKICDEQHPPNPNHFRTILPCDLKEIPKTRISSSTTLPYGWESDQPLYSEDLLQALNKNLGSLLDLTNPLFENTWVQAYSDRKDIFSALLLAQKDTILEDLLFLVDVKFPLDYPNSPPLYILSHCSTVEQNYVGHMDEILELHDFDEETTLLEGLQMARGRIESTDITQMRHGSGLFHISYFYPKKLKTLTPEEVDAWQNRWHEVIGTQAIRYVFNKIAYPDGRFENEILGHYRRILPELMTRWTSWTYGTSPFFMKPSTGFKHSVQNQLKKFEPFLGETLVPEITDVAQPQNPDSDSEEEIGENTNNDILS